MAKSIFFNKKDKLEKEIEEVVVEKEERKLEYKLRDTIVMDRNITKYIIENFSDIALDIRDSLVNFADTLENSIDYIEDKSSNVIKDSRNFKLSQDYRDKSMEIYNVVEKINDYVCWINEYYDAEKNKDHCKESIEASSAKVVVENDKEVKENRLCITEDFTSKQPKAFKIDSYYSEVSDWKELTVKAADILTKHYKKNKKNVNKEIAVDKVVLKESVENDFRDSVIDILKIYNVPLNKFYVYVEQ